MTLATTTDIQQNGTFTFQPEVHKRNEASDEIDRALRKFEKHFNIEFTRYALYSKSFLNEFHHNLTMTDENVKVQIATEHNKNLLDHFTFFSKVANTENPSNEHRRQYYERLQAVYATLDRSPGQFSENEKVAFIAPEREGRILAEKMGWLPDGHSFHPNAKRVHFEGGILIGLDDINTTCQFDRVEIIDGAIASGATLITIMECMASASNVFDIYSVHATIEGINALTRFAKSRGLQLTCSIGHVTAGLNDKYYAVEVVSNGERLVVGDLGDTISDLQEVISHEILS